MNVRTSSSSMMIHARSENWELKLLFFFSFNNARKITWKTGFLGIYLFFFNGGQQENNVRQRIEVNLQFQKVKVKKIYIKNVGVLPADYIFVL